MTSFEEPQKEYSRRSFLLGALGVVAGAGVGAVVIPPLAENTNKWTTELTGQPTGNANWQNELEDHCAQTSDPKACIQEGELSHKSKILGSTVIPLTEEVVFRGVPSFCLDVMEDDDKAKALRVVARGTETYKFTRNELIFGAFTSLIFGLSHNVPSGGLKGFDTKTIPASQTIDGAVYWGLARKFGIGSSIAAHAVFNARGLFKK